MISSAIPQKNQNVSSSGSLPLRPFFEKIIERKVDQLALTIFEKVVDFVCRKIYTAYCLRLDHLQNSRRERTANHEDDSHLGEGQGIFESAERTHRFMDGTLLYDRTTEKKIRIKSVTYRSLPANTTHQIDYITYDEKLIRFGSLSSDILFGRQYNTEFVTVEDLPEEPNLINIIEQETNGQIKKWTVNLLDYKRVPHRFIPTFFEEFYLAQENNR